MRPQGHAATDTSGAGRNEAGRHHADAPRLELCDETQQIGKRHGTQHQIGPMCPLRRQFVESDTSGLRLCFQKTQKRRATRRAACLRLQLPHEAGLGMHAHERCAFARHHARQPVDPR